MFLGDIGDAYLAPNGLPYHLTGTLNGLPPSPGFIDLDKKGNAG